MSKLCRCEGFWSCSELHGSYHQLDNNTCAPFKVPFTIGLSNSGLLEVHMKSVKSSFLNQDILKEPFLVFIFDVKFRAKMCTMSSFRTCTQKVKRKIIMEKSQETKSEKVRRKESQIL